MIEFIVKRISDISPHYNLTLMKEVHKRSGEIVKEPGDTLYTITLDNIKYRLANMEAISRFGDNDISLKEYLIEYYKCYNEICELLKRTL